MLVTPVGVRKKKRTKKCPHPSTSAKYIEPVCTMGIPKSIRSPKSMRPHDVLSILFKYFLTFFVIITYYLMSWRTFWRYDMVSILFDIMTCFPYFLSTFWHQSRHDPLFGFMTFCDVVTYLWQHDILFDIMKSYPYFLSTFWHQSHHDPLFGFMT